MRVVCVRNFACGITKMQGWDPPSLAGPAPYSCIPQCEMPPPLWAVGNKPASVAGVNLPLR